MIDLHLHLLPGLDDGPRDLAGSLDMARALVDAGVTRAAPSPHIYPELGWAPTRKQILGSLAQLQQEIADAEIPLQLEASAEHMYDATLLPRVDGEQAVAIGLKRFLLVELSTVVAPPDLPAALYQLRRRGLEPVLAHIERYSQLPQHAQRMVELHQQGYAMQVDAGALTGDYGRAQKKMAWKLLELGVVALVASDAHRASDVRTYLQKAQDLLRHRLGEGVSQRLLDEHPARILTGQALDLDA